MKSNEIEKLKTESWIRNGTIMGNTLGVLDLGPWLANHDRGHLSQIQILCGEY